MEPYNAIDSQGNLGRVFFNFIVAKLLILLET